MKRIVKASAGTGKTYRLALEYIAILLTREIGIYNEILFMTFTRAATAELKGRVFDFLKEIEKDPRGELVENIQKLYPDAKLNIGDVAEIRKDLLLNKDKMRIFTIDSFTGMVFKKAIGPYLNIYTYGHINSADEGRIYKEVFSKIVGGENFSKVKKFLEKTADRDVDKYLDLIKRVSADRWKFTDLPEKPENNDVEGMKQDLYRSVIEVSLGLKELVEEHGKDEVKVLGPATKRLVNRFGSEWAPAAEVTEYILSNMKVFRDEKYFNGTQAGGKARAHLKEALTEQQATIYSLLDKLIYYTEILPYERDIIEIEKIVRGIYDEIKFKEKGLTFSDITNYVSEYLYIDELDLVSKEVVDGKETLVVSENFYDIIGGKISTLFLDEAQDTSVNQWKVIEPIAKACKDVTIVGDEKQSIYSWRGGEKRLFASMGEILGAIEEPLPTSYRSHMRIIDFVNEFFSHISYHSGEVDSDYKWEYAKVECAKEEKGLGYVGVMADKDIVDRIAGDIEDRFKEGENYQGIGVIARKTSTLDEIGSALKNRGIPYITQNSLSITHHPCIVEMMRIFRYICHGDYLSLLEFMRGSSVGLGDSQMKNLLDRRSEIEEYLLDGEDVILSMVGVEEEIAKVLEKIRTLLATKYNILGRIVLEEFALLSNYKAPRDIKNINFFLEIMTDFDDLTGLMNYLTDNEGSDNLKQVGIGDINSVQLMTIHKSKGLEFHTEYMHIADKPSKYKMTGFDGVTKHQLNLMARMDDNYEKVEDYLFTNSKYETNIKDSSIYRYITETYEDEVLNTLYVGITRPVANLILCIEAQERSVKKVKTQMLLNETIIPPIKKYFGVEEEDLLDGREISKGTFLPYESEVNENEAVKWVIEDTGFYKEACEKQFVVDKADDVNTDEKPSYLYNVNGELRRKEGLAFHYMLECLSGIDEKSVELARKQMLIKYGNMLGDKRVEEIVTSTLKFLDKNKEIYDERFTVYKELELKTVETVDGKEKTRTHIIDRLNVDHSNGDIIIYDYKSGKTMDEEQLERYESVVLKRLGDRERGVEYTVIKKEFLTLR